MSNLWDYKKNNQPILKFSFQTCLNFLAVWMQSWCPACVVEPDLRAGFRVQDGTQGETGKMRQPQEKNISTRRCAWRKENCQLINDWTGRISLLTRHQLLKEKINKLMCYVCFISWCPVTSQVSSCTVPAWSFPGTSLQLEALPQPPLVPGRLQGCACSLHCALSPTAMGCVTPVLGTGQGIPPHACKGESKRDPGRQLQ